MTPFLKTLVHEASGALARWLTYSENWWYPIPDSPGLGCFGTGYDQWGVQTNQKYLATMAVAATHPAFGAESSPEMPADLARERALAALRYSLATHKSGTRLRTDGSQWGNTWISALGIERMAHGLDRLGPILADEDRVGIDRVLASEADDQLGEPIHASKWNGRHENRPESNIWNGAVCARAALHLPDHPHAADWTERAHIYWINGISLERDATDPTVLEGRTIAERHVGPNFFPHLALDHHGYLNLGYSVICLSNVAMIHYAYAGREMEAPATLYHHARDLWEMVRRFLAPDGRLLRIGGDTRIRYCYCQDYLLPVLVFAADVWKDPHALDLAKGLLGLLRHEQDEQEDGSFCGGRLAEVRRESPYYYTRLETDKAVVLSMLLDWLERFPPDPPAAQTSFEETVGGGWIEQEHGAVAHRSPLRLASFSWRAAERPQGLCLPPERSDLAEWQENLGSRVVPLARSFDRQPGAHTVQLFEGGFVTSGYVLDGVDAVVPEGWSAGSVANHWIAFAALPDGQAVLRLERVDLAALRLYLRRWEAVKLEIPNDLFNRRRRSYASASGNIDLEGHLGAESVLEVDSPWIHVDGALGCVGVYGAPGWSILRRGRPVGGEKNSFGSILTDTLCYGLRTTPFEVTGPGVLFENGVAFLSGVDATATEALARDTALTRIWPQGRTERDARCCALHAPGRDGRSYLLVANFSEEPLSTVLRVPAGEWHRLGTPAEGGAGGLLEVSLASCGSAVYAGPSGSETASA